MLSISQPMQKDKASTYYAKDNYYTKSKGEWYGKGAKILGLDGEIKHEDFTHIINGRSPSGRQIIQPVIRKHIELKTEQGQKSLGKGVFREGIVMTQKGSRIFKDESGHIIEEKKNGKRTDHGKGDIKLTAKEEHRAGLDLTFSAPKSVSIQALLDKRLEAAQSQAVIKTLKYIEKNYTQTRKTKKGFIKEIDTDNMVIALFNHETSRELDPQLHTHAFIANMTFQKGEKWRAMHNDKLYGRSKEGVKIYLGQIYRNYLSKTIKELGYAIENDEKGLFEIKGVFKEILEEFSQRSSQIEKKIPELKKKYPKASDQKLREIACLGSRCVKKNVEMKLIQQNWQERIETLGYTKEEINESVQKAAKRALERSEEHQKSNQNKLKAEDYLQMAADSITENESTFKQPEIYKNALKLSVGKLDLDEIEKGFKNLLKEKTISLLDRKNGIYTTKEMRTIERECIKKIREGRNTGKMILSEDKINQILSNKYDFLTKGQKAAVKHIFSSNDRYIAIQGDAGTGKTTSLGIVKKELTKLNYEITGLAYTGKAGSEIMKSAGIESHTLHSFLFSKNRGTSKTPGNKYDKLWVVDESSMTGSKRMIELLNRAEKENAKVVFIGDTKQLQAVEAGCMFSKLQQLNAIDTVEMKDIVRQQDEKYKDIIKNVADKDLDKAFERLQKDGHIRTTKGDKRLVQKLIKDYVKSGYKKTLVVTGLNRDRHILNSEIRKSLKDSNVLSNTEFTFLTKEQKSLKDIDKRFAHSYKIGDIIVIEKRGAGVRAGIEGRIISIDHESHRIKIKTPNNQTQEIDLINHGSKISAYTESETKIAENDKLIFLKNKKSLGVQNGLSGFVKKINQKGDITIVMSGETAKEINFNINDDYNYIDYGYAITDYKAQGESSEKVFCHAPVNNDIGHTFQSFYVSISRGKYELYIYTNDIEELRKQVEYEQEKKSTLLEYEQDDNLKKRKKITFTDKSNFSKIENSKVKHTKSARNPTKTNQLKYDIEAIKNNLSISQLLDHYGMLDGLIHKKNKISGPCPIHGGDNKSAFHVDVSKNVWNCFTQCSGGSSLDLIMKVEGCSIKEAIDRAISISNGSTPVLSQDNNGIASLINSPLSKSKKNIKKETPNKPLSFKLDLDSQHEYFKERNIDIETVKHFEAGFLHKGKYAGKICFPIKNKDGKIVAYSGRDLNPGAAMKYKIFPYGFKKGQELYNFHNVKKLNSDEIIIVEGFFDSMRLFQNSYPNVAALIGSHMSNDQAELLIKEKKKITLMLDGDKAGRKGTEKALELLEGQVDVTAKYLTEGLQPDSMTKKELDNYLETKKQDKGKNKKSIRDQQEKKIESPDSNQLKVKDKNQKEENDIQNIKDECLETDDCFCSICFEQKRKEVVSKISKKGLYAKDGVLLINDLDKKRNNWKNRNKKNHKPEIRKSALDIFSDMDRSKFDFGKEQELDF